MCLDSSTRMILKETEFGNLKDFLRHRDPSTTLHQQHLNEATLCVANALLFMVCEQGSVETIEMIDVFLFSGGLYLLL